MTALLLLLAANLGHAAFVQENDHEFTARGDFDGDGRTDVVIVDRATGIYRLGYQTAPNAFVFAPARAGGVEEVAGVSVGRLLSTSRDALALTAPGANRINILAANNPAQAANPASFFTANIGPAALAAIDIGGAGNTLHDDLFVGSAWNNAPPNRAELMRNTGSSLLVPLANQSLTGPPARANAVVLKTGLSPVVGLLLRGDMNDTFQAWRVSGGIFVQELNATIGIPSGAAYVVGPFDPGSPLAQVLFYTPGETGLAVQSIQEPSPGVFSLAPGPVFNLGDTIRQVFALTAPARLLVMFGGGETARIYDFDGSNLPVPGPLFNAPPGESLSGAALLGGNDFMLLSGTGGVSSRFEHHAYDGNNYVLQSSGLLPGFTPLSLRANVLALEFEPFADPAPHLLQSLQAADWSSGYTLSAGPQLTVLAESFGGAASGLGNPMPLNLGSTHPATQHVLVNQYTNNISLFGLNAPLGLEVAEVTITPAPGPYPTSVSIRFETNGQPVEVFYRLNAAGNWTLFTQPFWIFHDTTVSYYGRPIGSAAMKSTIRQAAYSFAQGPEELDSDGDGVPDYVEIANGLDPVESGNDGDGDGVFDLDELISGTCANNANCVTNKNDFPGDARPDLKGAVDLVLTPRPLDGTSLGLTYALENTFLRAYDLEGSLRGVGPTAPLPGAFGPTALISNVTVETGARLLVVATDPHFKVQTAAADNNIGRELLRLFDMTTFIMPVVFPPTWTGGDLQAEAAAWVSAVSNQVSQLTREQIVGELGPLDTLAALLCETKIREAFLQRGQTEFDALTLFPFRPPDTERTNPTLEQLRQLEQLGPGGEPAYLLAKLLGDIETALGAPFGSDPYTLLKSVTADIYRIGSASNNPPAQAVSWPVYPSPVNTLRDFLLTGVLESNYLAAAMLTPVQLQQAFAGAAGLLAGLGTRPVGQFDLVVRPDTFGGLDCVLLDTIDMTQTKSLVDPLGLPHQILQTFELLPGAVVHVTGFTDVINPACAGAGIEVIAVALESYPAPTPEDLDGDLLLDALELALFGSLDENGTGNQDGDPYTDLEEFLAGTDPTDPGSYPGAPPSNMNPPAMTISPNQAGGGLSVNWSWPPAYAGKVQFQVLSTSVLGTPFAPGNLIPTEVGPGQFEVTLPAPGPGSPQFYVLKMTLK